MANMKVDVFVATLKDIEKNYKTIYAHGAFGFPLTKANKERLLKHPINQQWKSKINNASSDTFAFDCVCIIKAILWGWYGDLNRVYGGASYLSNGVPDIGADTIIKSPHTINPSTNLATLEVGHVVWLEGHVGIYIGNSEVIEATTAFGGGVVKSKLSQRKWLKHGKLKYVDYDKKPDPDLKYKIGDKVILNGVLHGNADGGNPGKTYKDYVGIITRAIKGKTHPYNLDKDIGWVREKDLELYQEPEKPVEPEIPVEPEKPTEPSDKLIDFIIEVLRKLWERIKEMIRKGD